MQFFGCHLSVRLFILSSSYARVVFGFKTILFIMRLHTGRAQYAHIVQPVKPIAVRWTRFGVLFRFCLS